MGSVAVVRLASKTKRSFDEVVNRIVYISISVLKFILTMSVD